ncbi:MAG: hypothetical protein ACC661_09590 [Verrucomicrobiales bacterium]
MPSEFTCPACGEEIHPNAKRCPECGARAKPGGRGDHGEDGLDLPDEDFDYHEFVDREFGTKAHPPHLSLLWWVAGIILAIAFALMLLR